MTIRAMEKSKTFLLNSLLRACGVAPRRGVKARSAQRGRVSGSISCVVYRSEDRGKE